MRTVLFETNLWLSEPPHRVFPFLAHTANLESIKPSWLRFEVLTPLSVAVASGTRIDYRLRYHGVPMKWHSEIVKWNPPSWFVDSQVAEPYSDVGALACFRGARRGRLSLDRVKYAVVGVTLVNVLFVRLDVGRLFKYRQEKLTEVFGGRPEIAGRRNWGRV